MPQAKRKTLEATVAPLPHSWRLRDWDKHHKDIVPGSTDAAQNLIRTHKKELLAFGALTRVGRDLIVLGAGYAAFLASKMGRVEGYTVTARATEVRTGRKPPRESFNNEID